MAKTKRIPPSRAKAAPAKAVEPMLARPPMVAGIGASAGGLEAVTRVLQHLNTATGLAYVVVQHLAPQHESMLSELLNATSPIPVVQARDGMALQPNRVHVIPPDRELTITDG